MKKHYTKKLDNVIEINESQIQDHLGELVRGIVEETLNSMLDAEGAKEDKAGWSGFLKYLKERSLKPSGNAAAYIFTGISSGLCRKGR
ncbi:MAG: hypothetical protein KKA76_17080 [Proteobacteria bacterium]|nr:hypothetical protein [Pseudomonadota bacterium]